MRYLLGAAIALAAALPALSRLEAAPAVPASQAANSYDLRGPDRLEVSYSSSSIAGVPLLRYADRRGERNFRGDEIRTEETAVATLVTVRLRDTPDLERVDFTLVVPRVNVKETGAEEAVRTFGFWTRQRTTIGGPDLVDGQVQEYRAVRLRGTATALVF